MKKSWVEWEGRGEDSPRETELLKARVKAHLLGEPERAPQLGRFRLLHELGQGATGAVYEALDTRSGEHVALKLLRTRSARAVHGFKQEFRSLTDVVHENLVQLHELFADGDEWYFTMELVRGVKFTEYVRGVSGSSGERCDCERLRPVLGQLLSAVRAIHLAGKLHCDLKPSNVLVSEHGRVVVLDFGLLVHGADQEQTGTRERATSPDGTPPYMAPELDAGALPSAASDAYAIGVIMFVALTGRLPFEGSWSRMMQARAEAPAPRARELVSELPADLDALTAGLLVADPNARTTIVQALQALALSAAPAQASAPPVPFVRLVGRERELCELHRAFGDLQQGEPIAVLINGTSGIGKSALVERFAAELSGRALVLRGRCHERESLPYKAFDGVVDALVAPLSTLPAHALRALDRRELGALLRIFPHLSRSRELLGEPAPLLPASVYELRRLAFAGWKALLRELAQRQPLIVIVDDLQWADLDSARLLLDLLAPPDPPTLLYIGCYRAHEVERSEFLRELASSDGGAQPACERRFLPLGPLAQEAATALALEELRGAIEWPDGPKDACARIAVESEGVPLFVRELCAHFLLARPDAGPSLVELLETRLSALAASEHHALCLLSLAARPLAESLLVHAMSEQPAVQRALRALTVQGLVHADAAGSFVVYHDRLREHVGERIAAEHAAALHRRLAQAYEAAQDGEPEWLIEHWHAAGEHAIAYRYAIEAAGLAARKLAFNRAAELYSAALALAPDGDARRAELAVGRAEALVNAGRGAEAGHAFLAAVEHAGEELALELRCRALQQFLRTGHLDDANALLRVLLVEVDVRYPETLPAMVAQLLASRARLLLLRRMPRRRSVESKAGTLTPRERKRLLVLQAMFREMIVTDPVCSPVFHSLYYEAALRSGDEHSVFTAELWDTYFFVVLRGPRAGRALQVRLDRMRERAEQLGTPYAQASNEMIHGVADLFSGRYPTVVEHLQRALAIYRGQCLGTSWEESICTLTLGAALENVGPMTELSAVAPMLVRRAHDRNDLLTDALLAVHMSVVLLAEDRGDEARVFLAERVSRLSGKLPGKLDMQLMGVYLRVIDAQLYAGDGEAAFRTVEERWQDYLRSGFDRLQFWGAFTRMRRAHAAILLNTTRPEPRLVRIAAAEAKKLERMRRPDADVLAAGIRGAIAVHEGKLEVARAHMRRAVDAALGMGVPITAYAYQRQLGRITPGAQGAAMIAQADQGLHAQGIANPERWARMYAPGF